MRILCLGASTTDQATQSWPDTWCALLAAKLDAALDGPPIEAAAYGRGGMGVEQAVVELRRLLAGFRPDIVVVLLGVNDMTWGRRGEHAAGQTPSVDGQDCTGSSAAAPDGPALQIRRRLTLALKRIRSASAEPAAATLEWHSANLPAIRERFVRLPAATPAEDPQALTASRRASGN